MESPKPRLLLRDAINNNWENRSKAVSPLATSPVGSHLSGSGYYPTGDQCSGWCKHYPHQTTTSYTRSDSGFHSDFGGTSAGSRSPTPPSSRSPATSCLPSAGKTGMTRPLRILIVGGRQVGKSGLTVRYLSNQDRGVRRRATANSTESKGNNGRNALFVQWRSPLVLRGAYSKSHFRYKCCNKNIHFAYDRAPNLIFSHGGNKNRIQIISYP